MGSLCDPRQTDHPRDALQRVNGAKERVHFRRVRIVALAVEDVDAGAGLLEQHLRFGEELPGEGAAELRTTAHDAPGACVESRSSSSSRSNVSASNGLPR